MKQNSDPSSDQSAFVGTAPAPPDLDRLRERLDGYMDTHGLRSTEQRRLIIDIFFQTKAHLTIDQLLSLVREQDSKVGYATIYRAMKMLADSGVANEHRFEDGFTRYELADDEAHHDHLICLECGQITEFEEPLIEELQERVAARYGFMVAHHKHELYGRCANSQQCQQRKAAQPSGAPRNS